MNLFIPATAWDRCWANSKGQITTDWQHNHIEIGRSHHDSPVPNSKVQAKSWASGIWRKTHGYLAGVQFRVFITEADYQKARKGAKGLRSLLALT